MAVKNTVTPSAFVHAEMFALLPIVAFAPSCLTWRYVSTMKILIRICSWSLIRENGKFEQVQETKAVKRVNKVLVYYENVFDLTD